MTAKYDISLAVQAVRSLFFEAHCYEDCHNLVWNPSRFWIEQLLVENPKRILGLHECLISPPKTCNVYMVACQDRIIYIGTVVNKKKAEDIQSLLAEILPEKKNELKRRGPMAIIKWWNMCSIPVDADILTTESIEQGLQKYFQKFAPKLAGVPVSWIDNHTGISWDIFIKARQTAIHKTDEDCAKAYLIDL